MLQRFFVLRIRDGGAKMTALSREKTSAFRKPNFNASIGVKSEASVTDQFCNGNEIEKIKKKNK